jgi:O-antigen ligase
VLFVFVASGGVERSFGISSVIFDDYVMVAMPMALAMYLWAEGRKSVLYMGATFICLGGLIATQSRLSILFGLAAAGFVILAAYSRARRTAGVTVDCRGVKQKIRLLLAAAVGLVVLALVANQDLFSAVVERFEQLIGGDPFRDVGSVRFRAALWKRAFVTWMDHPIFGVGPGGFERLSDLYSTMHIGPDYRYIKGLGTHNMLLEYLATTGIVGGAGLLALAANKFRLARRAWRHQSTDSPGPSLALYAWAAIFVVTTLIEAGWTWRPPSLLMAFLAALVARQYSDAFDTPPPSVSS